MKAVIIGGMIFIGCSIMFSFSCIPNLGHEKYMLQGLGAIGMLLGLGLGLAGLFIKDKI